MNILAIETATEACSAAFLREDGQVFAEFEVAPRQHTNLLPKMMTAVLAAAGCPQSSLTHCAFSNGPGAFTGIRIAAATAQGIAIALNIPVLPISTLATLAQVSLDEQGGSSTMVALDARMGEVYWALYHGDADGIARLQGREMLSKIAEVAVSEVPDNGAGHGWSVGLEAWPDLRSVNIADDLLPDAKALLKLAARSDIQVSADRVSINYLRNQVAVKPPKT
ncbi:MAG: tRNA (adenosine(37)-N6)-threonylcarbamoyltransferase complex dimerization subunit type 1 TsaB [Gammaproteobacteria bacterium]|nr:tRNA (adenosine(37)-N6)-threonylcarbamoyltransferase complex dimerization subunit type 1 TsaB [Gammaproteobacteria bacterium]